MTLHRGERSYYQIYSFNATTLFSSPVVIWCFCTSHRNLQEQEVNCLQHLETRHFGHVVVTYKSLWDALLWRFVLYYRRHLHLITIDLIIRSNVCDCVSKESTSITSHDRRRLSPIGGKVLENIGYSQAQTGDRPLSIEFTQNAERMFNFHWDTPMCP